MYSAVATEVIRSAKEETFANRRASAAKLRWAVRGEAQLLMTRRRQAQRLRLRILVGMETRVDLSIADDDHGQHEAEEGSAHSNHAREADRLEHDVAEAGDLVRLDDFDYDRRGLAPASIDCTAGLSVRL